MLIQSASLVIQRKTNKLLKRKKKLVFAPSSLILTNYFLPVNWALVHSKLSVKLNYKGKVMNKGLIVLSIALSISACGKQTTTSNSSSQASYNVQSDECKGDAVEIAARVITNINAGKSDFFYKIDLAPYKNKGCDKALIDTAIKAML